MKNTNFEIAMECIGQALFEMFDKNTPKEVNNLLNKLPGVNYLSNSIKVTL